MCQQTMLCLLPLFHIYSMNVTMSPALRTGAKLLMLPKFDPSSFIKALEDHKVQIIVRIFWYLPLKQFRYKKLPYHLDYAIVANNSSCYTSTRFIPYNSSRCTWQAHGKCSTYSTCCSSGWSSFNTTIQNKISWYHGKRR